MCDTKVQLVELSSLMNARSKRSLNEVLSARNFEELRILAVTP
jgi:hypothetical protein